MLGEDRGNAEEFAHIAIEAGADLILGSGPQVLRGIEIYRGRLVSYGLGNFSGFHNFAPRGARRDGGAARHPGRGRRFPRRSPGLSPPGRSGPTVPDPEGGANLIAVLADEDFGSHAVKVSSSGRITAP